MVNFNLYKLLTLVAFLLVISKEAFSQKKTIKFGEIDRKDLEMKVYDKDSTAEAVILYDYGRSYYSTRSALDLYHERHIRIKILKTEGLSWADFEIFNRKQYVTSFKAATYNLEGNEIKSTPLDRKEIFEEKIVGQAKRLKIAMPAVKVGSVIEISYVEELFSFFNYQSWTFQRLIPTIWSEYNAEFRNTGEFDRHMQGNVPLIVNDNKGQVMRWVAKDIPAIKKESHVRSLKDYVGRITFSANQIGYYNFSKWESLISILLSENNYGKWIKGYGVKRVLDEIGVDKNDDANKKLNQIYNYITNNIEWDEYYGITPDKNAKDIIKDKKGDAADINLLLLAMLNKAGIKAEPVILSTRKNGKVHPVFPMISKYNYVICLATIDGKEILLDATDSAIPLGELPFRCLNGQGKLIGKLTKWVPLEKGIASSKTINAILKIDDEGLMNGTVSTVVKGQQAIKVRKKDESELKESLFNHYTELLNDSEIENFSLKNFEAINKPLKTNFEVEIEGEFVEMAGDLIYLDPMLGFNKKENPFNKDDRKFLVELDYTKAETIISNISLPEGYQIESKPQNISLSLPNKGGKFLFMVNEVGGNIQLMSKIVFTNTMYLPDQYYQLKEFYNQIISKQAEKIVLKKIDQ